MKSQPPRLYRYVDALTAWECLENATLAFIPPARFNDPFDTNPALNCDCTEDQLKALERTCPPGKCFDQESIEGAMIETRKVFMEAHLGVACFSSRANDPLMWAHYGDRHRGVMIGFDTSHSDISRAEPVKYSQNRPRVSVDEGEFAKKILVKSVIWEGESEWRLFAELRKCEVKMIKHVPVYIQHLERACFASITFGCRADPALVVAISNSLQRWQLTKCDISRVRLCDATYDLVLEPIDIT